MNNARKGTIRAINGPVIRGVHMTGFGIHEMVEVGDWAKLFRWMWIMP